MSLSCLGPLEKVTFFMGHCVCTQDLNRQKKYSGPHHTNSGLDGELEYKVNSGFSQFFRA